MNQESQSCCPVCTLYLRPGISLHTHLNTHPKKHVIKALLLLANHLPQSSKPIEQSEENLSDDSCSTSSVSSCHSVTLNTQDEVQNTDRNNANSCPSPKSQNSQALSELRDALEENQEDDMEINDNNINFDGEYRREFEEDHLDGSISFQGESNESTQHCEVSEETASSLAENYNDPFHSNGNPIENEEYMSRYFYSSENARISHTDPDPQLNPPQYSTLNIMELHPEYISSNHQEHQLTLDIQTDELMPAHGELSGQESLEPPEPILASIWTMKSGDESKPHTSTSWNDTEVILHEVSTAARHLMSLKNREEIPKEEIIEKKEVKPLIGKLICPYCKLKFDGVKVRKEHINEEHKNEEGVKKGLMYIKPLSTKLESEEGDHQCLKVECSICGQVFEDYLKMTLHFMDTHKGMIYNYDIYFKETRVQVVHLELQALAFLCSVLRTGPYL